jgi:hypothetical protein
VTFKDLQKLAKPNSYDRKAVIEESRRAMVNAWKTPTLGMLLPFSFEPDLSHTSILYYYYPISQHYDI